MIKTVTSLFAGIWLFIGMRFGIGIDMFGSFAFAAALINTIYAVGEK